jgi:hypothetical protein
MARSARPHLNLVYADNGRGLTRDAAILRGVLISLGCRVQSRP